MPATRSNAPRHPQPGALALQARRRLGAWLALGIAGLATACAAQTSAPSRPGAPGAGVEAETALRAHIDAEIGSAACNSDAQCRLLPLGAKACGGPEGWKAWSSSTGQPQRLRAWADELAALQRQRIQAQGLMSNCRYEAEPGVGCVNQRCVLRPQGDAK